MIRYFIILIFFCVLFTRSQSQSKYFEKAQSAYHLDTAVKYGEIYYTEVKATNNTDEQFEVLCFLAEKYNIIGLYEKSENYLKTAEVIANRKQDQKLLAQVYLNKGNLEKGKDDFGSALEFYLKSEKIFKAKENWVGLSRCYIALAEFYRKFADFEKAQRFIEMGFETQLKIVPRDISIEIKLNNRAAAIHNESDVDKSISIAYSKRAITLADSINDFYSLGVSYNELGFSFKNQNKSDSSEYYYLLAEENWMQVGAFLNVMHVMNNRAMLFAHNDFPKEKITSIYFEIIERVKKFNIPYNLKDVYLYLCFEEQKTGDFKNALEYFSLFHDEELKALKSKYDINVLNITERYENEKIKDEVKAVNRELDIKKEGLNQIRNEKNVLIKLLIVLILFFVLIIFLLLRIKISNKQLKEKNDEKDVLLKEVHHRVKNNLQVITSILELQGLKTSDADTQTVLNECRNRINAMSLVHKRLYQNEDLARLSCKEFLNDLISALTQSYHGEEGVEFILKGCENVYFDVDTSIPLGLMLNELITNSFKHAILPNRKLVIQIEMETLENGSNQLTFTDNGQGISDTIQIEKTTSLGLSLVRSLVKQLDGKLSYMKNEGSVFKIVFLNTNLRKQKD